MCSSVQGASVATLDRGIHTVGSLRGRDNLKHPATMESEVSELL